MRQFVSSAPPDKSGLFFVRGKDFKYRRQVLRLKTGDMLCVRSPDGKLFNTTICKTDEAKRTLTLQVCGTGDTSDTDGISNGRKANAERGVLAEAIQQEASGIEYWLFQLVPQPSKMELILLQASIRKKQGLPLSKKAAVSGFCALSAKRASKAALR